MGGIGKTELAREVARRLRRQQPKPPGVSVVAEVNLRGWDSAQPMTEEEALRELCAQIDSATDPSMPLPNLRAHWRQITNQGSPAVILDNLRDESLIDALRPTAGMTLITGRERIIRAGIQLVEVDVMEPEEAAALAIATHPDLSKEDAAGLAKAVGYLPLAIALAAADLARSREPVSELQRRIGQAAGGDTRTGMQALFERVVAYSTADLSAEQRARWLALSLPPGDFGLWTVQALWQDEDPQPELSDLVNRHLVLPAEGGRWRLHDLLRQYGRSVLAAEPEREQDLWRWLGPTAVRRLQEIDARFRSGGDAMVPALAELDAELPLLRAVQEWAAARIEEDDVAAEVASRLPHVTIVDLRLTNAENMDWLQAALHAAEHRGEKAEIATAAGNLGLVHRVRGELEEALAMHRKSLAIAEELGNRASMARQYGNLGLVHQQRGELEEALAMHRKSLAIHEELGNQTGIARQYGNLGVVHRRRGELGEAAKLLRKKIAIDEDMGNRPELAIGLYNLGNVLKNQGDWAGAAEHFRLSLALAEELGMPDADQDRQALAEAEAYLAGGAKAEGDPG